MNEQDAWNNFLRTGSVHDYLQYKAVKSEKNTNTNPQGITDEIKDRGTYYKTTEYR